jgi:hypothetical protein
MTMAHQPSAPYGVLSPNAPPYQPSNPDPYDGESNVDINHDISWVGGDPDPGDTVSYDVYFGTTVSPPKISDNQTGLSFEPGTLNYNEMYYWRIVAWDNHGADNTSGLWSFTTIDNDPPILGIPNPANGSTNQPLAFTWSIPINDPDGDTFNWSITCSNGQTNSGTGASNGTKTLSLTSLALLTSYTVWVNTTDPAGSTQNTRAWFTFTTRENNPPHTPTDPTPTHQATDVSITTDLSWTGGDPDGDPVIYDVYMGTTTPPPKIADDLTITIYDPGTLSHETHYYWQIISEDPYGEITVGPIWQFSTENEPTPNLDCIGSLSWTQVPAGSTQTGSFTVENIGDSTSLLDWEIESYPNWGSWTFTPSSGTDLTPEIGPITVNVEVIVPNQQEETFSGEIKIINLENASDYELIPVSLSTPKPQVSSIPKTILMIQQTKQFLASF